MTFNNVLIFGDSYSTFEGYIPQGYDVYYTKNGDNDVKSVDKTWWYSLITETNSKLVLNDSWSGSTIGYTGYGNSDCSKSSSFIRRLRKLSEEGFFENNKIDTVFVYGGTNDSWSDAPLGEFKLSDFEDKEFFSVLPAIGYYFQLLKETLPDADIYCLINTELKKEITDALLKASNYVGINTVKFTHIDKVNGHPTAKGMQEIKEQILEVARNK